MTELLPAYQSDGVIDVCPSCESWANKMKSALIDDIAPRMRSAIENRASSQAAAPTIWTRLKKAIT